MQFTEESLKQALITKIQEDSKFEKNILTEGVYSSMLDVDAFGLNLLAYYAEFLYKESVWKTASKRESLIAKAYLLNYFPHRKIGANGNLTLSFDSTFSLATPTTYTGENVIIPKWTVFTDKTKTSSTYCINEVIYPKGIVVVNATIDSLGSATLVSNTKVGIPVANHNMPIGQSVSISGSVNYTGNFIIQQESTTNIVVIESDYTAEIFTGAEKIFTGNVFIPVREGEVKDFLYIANGDVNEEISLFSNSVDNDIIEVFITDANKNVLNTVTITTEPYFVNDLVNYYCEIVNTNDFTDTIIRFGDGFKTRKLIAGEYVHIKYAETKGVEGNISNIDSIDTFKTVVLDLQGNVHKLFVSNKEPIVSGSDIEDKESIRENGKRLFYTGYRAGSAKDWVSIIESHTSVHKAIVWTEYDLNNTSVSALQHVTYVTGISTTGDTLSQAIKSDLSLNYLKDKRDVTDVVIFKPLQTVFLRFTVNATIKNVTKVEVKNSIFTELASRYSILNTDFQTNVYESNFSKLIDSIDNVLYHKTKLEYVEKTENFRDLDGNLPARPIVVSLTSAEESDVKKQIYVQPSTVKVFLKRKIASVWQTELQIIKTNTVTPTQLKGINSYTVTGAVSYTTNNVSWAITEIVSDNVATSEVDSSFGYQDLGLSVKETDLSGLLPTTQYYFKVDNGGGVVEYDFTTTSAPTYEEVATLITGKIIGDNLKAIVVGGDIRIINNITGATSTISLSVGTTGTDLFTSLTGYTAFGIAVVGQVSSYGVLNPSATDSDGYVLRLVYKSQDGNGELLNDVRLANFFHITSMDEENMFYDLEYK